MASDAGTQTVASEETARVAAPTKVRDFRQILLWPVQLMPLRENVQSHRHWELIAASGTQNPWHEVVGGFSGDGGGFEQRHYAEFVNFLPYVQRVVYGEGKNARGLSGESAIKVFRRADVQAMRITLDRLGAPIEFRVTHVDLCFFLDSKWDPLESTCRHASLSIL